MAKSALRYVCQDCGSVYRRWQGKCDGCGAWNSIQDEPDPQNAAPPLGTAHAGARRKAGAGKAVEFAALKGELSSQQRLKSQSDEFDRVLGGGFVAGGAVLIGGDPGIGKSTLLLQAAAKVSTGARALYFSGEEAIDQIRMRAQRLGLSDADVELASCTNVQDIQAAIAKTKTPAIAVIDSIQTMYVDGVEAAPGSVTQVRLSAQELIRTAKAAGVALLLVGHVTKDGAIAGPRVLEHMVDTVLYFEGERGHPYRILRSIKNRFGATDEIGVFDMTEKGLMEVANPSALFLAERQAGISGAAVFAGMEGTRPLLVEVQALVAPTSFATPRRAVVGWDMNRLAMLLAVLETRGGLPLSGRDVYLNVAGGLKISEPAADLAVAAAIISAIDDEPLKEQAVFCGEIGLGGEIRSISQIQNRLREASKLGFGEFWGPNLRGRDKSAQKSGAKAAIDYHPLNDIKDLIEALR